MHNSNEDEISTLFIFSLFYIFQIGPVDITKGTSNNNGKSPNKVSASGSAFSKTILGFRPRATTADSGSYNRPRPRATTVSHGSSNGNSSVGKQINQQLHEKSFKLNSLVISNIYQKH